MSTLVFPNANPDPDDRQKVGRYEIVEKIGEGSMGVVFLAHDPLIGRRVALKMLSARFRSRSPDQGDDLETLRAQFVNEAKSAGALSHPGIVTIHDLVDDPETGDLSIAMEYVPGETLRQILDRPAPPPLEVVADLVRQIADVLDFAHARGVVHRDIKPANVIVRDDGQVKIADFGIASLSGRDLASALKSMGTPNYLAPERILGQEADHRGDVYSLGVLLYEMVARHLPFHGESLAELASNVVQEDFTPLEAYRPELAPGVREVIARALEKDPEDRYQRAGDLADALDRIVVKLARLSHTMPVPVLERATAPPAEEPAATVEPTVPAVAAPARDARTSFSALLEAVTRQRAAFAARLRSGVAPLTDPRRWNRRRAAMAGVTLLALVALLLAATAWRSSEPQVADDGAAAAEQASRLEYLALLREVQRLYDAGEVEVAERLLDQAELVSPGVARIRQMREAARARVEAEHAALREAQVIDLVLTAEEALERGDVATAGAALFKALELDPEHAPAVELQAAVEARQRRRNRPRPQPVAEVEPQAPVAAALTFEAVARSAVVAVPAPALTGTLRVRFASELPRGVLTIYSGTSQILNRKFRFVERKGFLRRKGVGGGFDDEVTLPAGELRLRVYVSLPGRATSSVALAGDLPRGGVQTLTVEIDPSGEMTARFL